MLSLAITGSPGVGKHTVGEKVARMLDLEMLDLNTLAADSGAIEKDAQSVDVHILGEALASALGSDSLVVGHLAPYVLTGQQVRKMVVLRKSPYALVPVYEGRGYSDQKSRTNIGAEILGIIAHDAARAVGGKAIQLDVTSGSISDVALRVRDALEGSRGGDSVDWLSMVTERGELRRFFSYD